MGEYAEMMLDGTCCAGCGEYLGEEVGYPIYCSNCRRSMRDDQPTKGQRVHACTVCGKRFKSQYATDQHARDKHGKPAAATGGEGT